MGNNLHQKIPKKVYNILIIEDHLLLSDAIKMVLNLVPKNETLYNFKIDQALDYKSAVAKIENAITKGCLDVVILDIRLGKSKDGERRSGEELGSLIRSCLPKTKIVVLTSFSDGLIINSIIKNVNPEGFLIKNNASNHKLLQEVIVKIIKGETYYCNIVSNILRRRNTKKNKLDPIDIKLLYELSLSTKIKDIPKYIPLKLSGVEKRLRRLKEIFEVDNNRNLLLKAKENGFL